MSVQKKDVSLVTKKPRVTLESATKDAFAKRGSDKSQAKKG